MSLTVATMPLAKVIELDTLLFNVLKLFFLLFDQEISVILKAPIDVLQSLDQHDEFDILRLNELLRHLKTTFKRENSKKLALVNSVATILTSWDTLQWAAHCGSHR